MYNDNDDDDDDDADGAIWMTTKNIIYSNQPNTHTPNPTHPPTHVVTKYIEALVAMGYNRQEIEASLSQVRYDDVFATYLLLGRKSTDVST